VVAVTVGERQGGAANRERAQVSLDFCKPDFARNPSALSAHNPDPSASPLCRPSPLIPPPPSPWPVLKAIEPVARAARQPPSPSHPARVVQVYKLKRSASNRW
jgi:hypothetical protein